LRTLQSVNKLLWCNMKNMKLGNLVPIIAHPPISSYDVAFYGGLTKDGVVAYATNMACHAALSYPERWWNEKTKPDYIWSKLMPSHDGGTITAEDKDLFINYMLKESPWASVFVNKTVAGVEKYGWIADAEADAHFLVNALVATRLISEFTTNRFSFWKNAIKAGMSKDMAMVLSQYCSDSKGETFYLNTVSGHGFVYDLDTEIIKRFVNKTPKMLGKSYKQHMTYNRHCDVWDGKGGDYYSDGKVGALLAKIPVYKQVDKVNLNIFYKEKKRGSYDYIYHSYDSAKYFEKQVKEKLCA
jgi:hypothetical protein